MGFDKAVDSQQLDRAIKSTANAIRSKTINKNPIPWNKETGFASVIQNLNTTEGFFIGNFVVGEDAVVTTTKPLSVRGMKSKPKHLIAFVMPNTGEPAYSTYNAQSLCFVEKGVRDNICMISGYIGQGYIAQTDRYRVVLENDGFSIYGIYDSTCYVTPGSWGYIVITEESGTSGGVNAVVENSTLVIRT